MNTPYGLALRAWIRKAHESALAGATVVCLVPARTDARWWHDYVIPYAEIRFIRGRIRFGNSPNSAPFASAVVIFRALTNAAEPCSGGWTDKQSGSRQNGEQGFGDTMPQDVFQKAYEKTRSERAALSKRLA